MKMTKGFLKDGKIISKNTLRQSDLIYSHKEFLKSIIFDNNSLKNKDRYLYSEIKDKIYEAEVYLNFKELYREMMGVELENQDVLEMGSFILADIKMVIYELTPKDYYYGNQPGDGACFGIFIDEPNEREV